MATGLTVSGAHPVGEPAAGPPAPIEEPVALDSFAGRIEVQWAPDEAVTALGQLPFFIDFLKQSDLFEPFVAEAPLRYASPNAPQVRDVLGTLLLAVTNGATRYSHVNAVRHDGVNPGLLDMRRVCSDDSVLRAMGRMPKEDAEKWLRRHLSQGVRPLLQEPWVLDIDTTVKPVYGHQEGAEIGYNPLRKGRPSMAIHTYQMGVTRLVLEVDVEAGNRNHSKYGLPGLGRLLDGLREEERPQLVRGDRGYGTERVMGVLEERGQDYLFKLMMKPGVKRLVQELAGRQGWAEAGQGWQAAEARLQLAGWRRSRRVVVQRRRRKRPQRGRERRLAGKQLELGFEEGELVLGKEGLYEYSVLVTSLEYEAGAVAQLYRDRGDMENAVDEMKNQWGWGGFVTQDLKRTRIMARMNALFYNWWSLFVRLISPEARREAQTSRPTMLAGVGRVTRHSRQKKLLLTIAHSASRGLRAAFEALARFLREVQNAPQWSAVERWCRILSRAYRKYFGGRILKPPPGLLPA